MAHQVTIGGDRLGSGKRMRVELHGYERSTHDIGTTWKSTMAAGTLVPFMSLLALPGDTFDIDLEADVLTKPTVGPLYGSYQLQLDVFQVQIRLYNSKLHMNLLNVGLDMSKVKLPQIQVEANGLINPALSPDNQQINPSALLSYLNIRGAGYRTDAVEPETVIRHFNAVPLLGYWDCYKNYYANKQEEIGAYIHKNPDEQTPIISSALISNREITNGVLPYNPPTTPSIQVTLFPETIVVIEADPITNGTQATGNQWVFADGTHTYYRNATTLFNTVILNTENQTLYLSNPKEEFVNNAYTFERVYFLVNSNEVDQEPTIVTFPLSNIDDMRRQILQTFSDAPFVITRLTEAPYGPMLQKGTLPTSLNMYPLQYSQEGLALRPYKSDLFNNWIQTEWIDGTGGINEITAISTAGANFTLDELNLKQKIYNMLNRIALSGGSYEDWLNAVYDHEKHRAAENPIYLGGLIKNIVFQEVVSNAATADQPLGTLAGRGRIGQKNIGGHITVKIDEPSYILGIVSIVPNLDYSQGNAWDTNLKSLDDLHKPALDEIGFQDLITDQMAWWDTATTPAGVVTFKSAGKQPAWINYMTDVNQVRGNFAEQTSEMFMVLNRRYVMGFNGTNPTIEDLTTYIDPTKFNNIFADTRLDAQNFWVQIGKNITTRRKMSAKVIPNL